MNEEPPGLESLPYFAGLTDAQLDEARQALSPLALAVGETLFSQGDHGSWIYILQRGRVQVSMRPSVAPGSTRAEALNEEDDPVRVLAIVSAPALLGEMSVLLDEPRSATATVLEECALWQVSSEGWMRALEEGDAWARRISRSLLVILAARLAEGNRRIGALLDAQSCASPESGGASPLSAPLRDVQRSLFSLSFE
jgi:CRP/FNR family cyclic AMP-dependent transcriptional regulator